VRAAQVELLRGAMQLGEVSSVYLADSVPDTVALQDPAPGTTDVTSPHVNLLVALGPRPPAFVMPELAGLPVGEAQSRLGAAGLKVSKLTPEQASGLPPGTVAAQMPPRGARVDPGTTIELQIAE
jgi:beta-lactam-binding protein with PASTA domain